MSENNSLVLQKDLRYSGCNYPCMECYKRKERNGIS